MGPTRYRGTGCAPKVKDREGSPLAVPRNARQAPLVEPNLEGGAYFGDDREVAEPGGTTLKSRLVVSAR